MAETKVAILGGNGMLGSDLCRELQSRNISCQSFDLPEFDITREDDIRNVLSHYDRVINCAAYTNVEKAEDETELAQAINANAVGTLAKIAREMDRYIIHISTDFVFDGHGDKPWIETDTTNPINAYGATKLAGEKLLQQSGCKSCIIRVEWTYGINGNNFVKKLIDFASQKEMVKVVDDQIGSPTATTEAAIAIAGLLQKDAQGLYHFAANGFVSRYEMAKFIFNKLDINTKLIPCKSVDFPTKAKRPLNSRFCCDKIRPLLNQPIRTWQQALDDFLRVL
jgi:dTDP-4-dehydrorhamnose reductase